MAARPPRDDGDSDPDVVEFGIAALAARLEDVDLTYPVERSELRRRMGAESIPYDAAGNELRLTEALSELDRERFEDESELLNALHPVFERHRVESGKSVVRQMRALLPF